MQVIGLVVNVDKPGGEETAAQMLEWLQARGLTVYITRKGLSRGEFGSLTWCEGAQQPKLDCVIVLGGDGTLLQTARELADSGIPVLGVNFGQLGFLTEIEIGEITPALEKLLAGEYYIDERMMLEAVLYRNGQPVERSIALNDVVIAKGAFARLISLDMFIDDEPVGVYPADGVIIATPTGSTAYSLSAGGPIVPPSLGVILVTPVCPHSLTSRPMVISPDSRVRVRVSSQVGQVMLTLDGQHGFELQYDDEIVIRRYTKGAKIIKLQGRSFFRVLGAKLKTGDRCYV
ncbi:MAG TPA: NAD(+)/NADH kinase [Bacillota bacterium]|nr:NAD(+)/NADH kinase [Bacillota bacterium]